MQNRLSRRGTRALIIYFLMITALCAPLAFFAGRAQGRSASENEPPLLSQNGAFIPISLAMAPGEVGAGGATNPDATDPGANGNRPDGGGAFGGDQHNGANGPLQNAVLNTLGEGVQRGGLATLGQGPNAGATDGVSGPGAGGASGGGEPVVGGGFFPDPPQPSYLAGNSGAGGSYAGGAGFGGGGASGGFGGGFGGAPPALIPNILQTDGPAEETPVLATPIPGALPLMIAGICALCFAAGRPKSA